MLRTIYGKLSMIMLALFLVMGLIFTGLNIMSNRMYLQEASQRLNQSVAKYLVSSRALMVDGQVNRQALEDVYYELMDINPAIEIYLLDNFGHILSTSESESEIRQDHVALEPVFQFLDEQARYPVLGDDPKEPGKRKIFSACPIPISGPPTGYLYTVLGGIGVETLPGMLAGSNVVRMSVYAALVGLVLVSIFGLYLFNHLTRRLRRLTSAMEAFEEGGYSPGAGGMREGEGGSEDEIDRMGRVFDRMARRIGEQMDELKGLDSQRRELVTNVSHDLRTPLTSLQGYLETLTYKEDLSAAERADYLEAALKQSDRLRRLVTDLFELSLLDAHQVSFNPEPFSLSELTQDVVQKFRIPAEKKGLSLEADITQGLPFVVADIGLIERVLENLIKNAIQYTPSGGTVTVTISRDGNRMRATVKDTGQGIHEEDLPYIFDRYFRAKADYPEPVDGSGLGLAITRRIINLHGSTIQARSEPGEGTAFTFHLPVA